MATKLAMTSEAIALTEKKMGMTLDEIIKMSKESSSQAKMTRPSNKSQGLLNGHPSQANSSKVQRFTDSRSSLRQGVLAQRRSNFRGNQFPYAKEAARKAAVTPIRNRVLIRNRVANWNRARKAAVTPIRNRVLIRNRVANWNRPRVTVPPVQKMVVEGGFAGGQAKAVPKQRPRTLDSLFANMKEQRMRVLSQQQMLGGQNVQCQGVRQQQQRHRGGGSAGAYFPNY